MIYYIGNKEEVRSMKKQVWAKHGIWIALDYIAIAIAVIAIAIFLIRLRTNDGLSIAMLIIMGLWPIYHFGRRGLRPLPNVAFINDEKLVEIYYDGYDELTDIPKYRCETEGESTIFIRRSPINIRRR